MAKVAMRRMRLTNSLFSLLASRERTGPWIREIEINPPPTRIYWRASVVDRHGTQEAHAWSGVVHMTNANEGRYEEIL